jgi:hypothetical protein
MEATSKANGLGYRSPLQFQFNSHLIQGTFHAIDDEHDEGKALAIFFLVPASMVCRQDNIQAANAGCVAVE